MGSVVGSAPTLRTGQVWGSTSGRGKNFSLVLNIQTGCGSKHAARSSQYRHWMCQRYQGDHLKEGGPLKEINFRF